MISRDKYLAELVSLQGNGMIKVITGMRRCGKSYLLFEIFASHLEQQGVAPDHIVKVDLEDYKNKSLRNPDNLYEYVESRIVDNGRYYVMLDEVQMLDHFEDVLNGFWRPHWHLDLWGQFFCLGGWGFEHNNCNTADYRSPWFRGIWNSLPYEKEIPAFGSSWWIYKLDGVSSWKRTLGKCLSSVIAGRLYCRCVCGNSCKNL